MPDIDIMAVIKPELAQAIKTNLEDSSKSGIWQDYREQLIKKVKQIRKHNRLRTQLGKRYQDALNQLFNSAGLSTLKTIDTQKKAFSLSLQKLIQELFILEHKIMAELSGGMADTSEYIIYYSDGSQGVSEVTRAVISAEELYNSNNVLTMTKAGIMLQHSTINQLFNESNTSKLTNEQQKTYSEIAEVAMKDMEEALNKLRKELEKIDKTKRKEHLGEDLWNKYQRLQHLVGTGVESPTWQGAYARFMIQQSYTSLRGSFFNRGHLFEALERYIAGETSDLSTIFGESLGRDPWWTGGDIQLQRKDGTWINRQVKALIKDDKTIGDPMVQVASLNSIFELASSLITLLDTHDAIIHNSLNFLENKINEQTNRTNSTVGRRISQTIDILMRQRFNLTR